MDRVSGGGLEEKRTSMPKSGRRLVHSWQWGSLVICEAYERGDVSYDGEVERCGSPRNLKHTTETPDARLNCTK